MSEMTQAAFARDQGWSKSHVTALKQAGRLVMSDSGKLVLVKESLSRIKATEDPNRDDVRQRHKAGRGEDQESDVSPGTEKVGKSYQQARAVKERYAALSAKLSYEKEAGTVVAAADVAKSGIELGTFIRTKLENLPDQLAPELAPISDPARVHAVLVEHFESLLTDISRQLAALVEVSK